MKKIYTISAQSYDDNKVYIYTDREEWKRAMDEMSEQENTRGRGDGLEVSIHEIPDDAEVSVSSDRGWTGKEHHGRRVYANNDSIVMTRIDEDGDEVEEELAAPAETQKISYWYVREIEDADDENSGKYQSTNGEIYDTEEEGRECEKPSQYLFI